MKLLPVLAAATLALTATIATSGCKSNVTNLRQQISPTYQSVVVEADKPAAYDASLAALRQMGYTITNSGAAQGKIEAISSVMPGTTAGSAARQYTASVRFGVAPNNSTEIQILFTETRDDVFNSRDGMGTKQPLADSPLYGVFSSYVNATLKK